MTNLPENIPLVKLSEPKNGRASKVMQPKLYPPHHNINRDKQRTGCNAAAGCEQLIVAEVNRSIDSTVKGIQHDQHKGCGAKQ
jgi:hypothetical protein